MTEEDLRRQLRAMDLAVARSMRAELAEGAGLTVERVSQLIRNEQRRRRRARERERAQVSDPGKREGRTRRPSRASGGPGPAAVPDLPAAVEGAAAPGPSAPAPPSPLKVHLWPQARGVDDGQGGVRRVIEGMQAHLGAFGIELVDSPEAADVIATHIQIPAGWEVRYRDRPFVAHCHGLYWSEFEWPTWAEEANLLVLRALAAAHAATVPSEWVARIVERHTGRRPVVVPHGIDVAEWRADAPRAGYVYWDKTRPDPVCDPSHLDELAKLLPDVRFVTTYGTEAANVTVTGRVPFEEAKATMEGASVYLATARETFGVSILQAFAAGVPVVGWRWGGQAELVEDGVTGRLVRPFDYEALAEAVRWALREGPALRQNLRAAAERYPWERAAKLYAEVYREAWLERYGRPRTSIIVTAYRLEAYLRDCLESVLAQTDPDWECIVVDDASPDGCGEIAEEFARRDARFRVIHNERNLYLAGARNVGLAAARGRYVMALDADDMLPPHAVRLLAEALDSDPMTAIAYGAVYFVGEDGQTPQRYGSRWPPGRSGWPIDFSWELQLQGSTIVDGERRVSPNCLPYSAMVRRRALLSLGGWRERCRTAEDADCWARLSSYGWRPRRVTDAETLIYRVRRDSMSQTHPRVDHTLWLGWRGPKRELAPAGSGIYASSGGQVRVPSLEPPGISVIVPVGPGHERLVQRAVDSVEAQTWRGWEVIVVNDTGKPLPPILPCWVRVVDTPGGVGPGAARNLGARRARARLLLWLDADDFLQPDALRTFWETALREGTGTVYYSDFWEDPGQAGEWRVYETPDWDPQLLISDGMISAVTMLVPREVHERIGGFDPQLEGWEDWAYQIALADANVCSRRIAAPLFSYSKHTGRRREENLAAFEALKEQILERWGAYWKGEKQMACAGCGRGARSTVRPQGSTRQQAAPEPAAGLVPVIYTGPRTALHSYRAPSGQTYRFARGRWNYVRAEDVDWLLKLKGFALYRGDAPVTEQAGGPALA